MKTQLTTFTVVSLFFSTVIYVFIFSSNTLHPACVILIVPHHSIISNTLHHRCVRLLNLIEIWACVKNLSIHLCLAGEQPLVQQTRSVKTIAQGSLSISAVENVAILIAELPVTQQHVSPISEAEYWAIIHIESFNLLKPHEESDAFRRDEMCGKQMNSRLRTEISELQA